MSGTQPVGVYAMKVPPGDILLPAVPDFAAMFRVSMAAIDPTEEPMYEVGDTEKKAPRATLKIVRVPGDMFGDDEDDSDDSDDYDAELDMLNGLGEDDEDDEDDDEDSGEEVNGGPSVPKLVKTIKAELDNNDEDMEDDEDAEDEDDAKAIATLQKLMKRKGKAKAKAEGSDEEEDEDDYDDDDDEDPLELEEVVVCTLDLEKNYQQTLDFVVGEDERVFFKVSGTHTVHLTGNYVIPMDDGQAQLYDDEDDEGDYDLSPDEEELDEEGLDALEDEESDELDDIEDPRITEVASEEEISALINDTAKGKNKRPAEDSADDDEEETNLDDLMAKSLKKDESVPGTNGDTKKLSKAEKKKLKKLKKNDGEAVTPESKKEAAITNGSEKKSVQFAKNLELGPTPSVTPPAKAADKKIQEKKEEKPASAGIKDVQGVTVDDRKVGSGPAAKKGSRIEMRYIGKLESGKVFDSNKKGKPFSFKLGVGEVIKGWDVGVAGMSAGGERRLTIPAHHGYGKKGAPPDIPPNSKLIFDIKCLSVQ